MILINFLVPHRRRNDSPKILWNKITVLLVDTDSYLIRLARWWWSHQVEAVGPGEHEWTTFPTHLVTPALSEIDMFLSRRSSLSRETGGKWMSEYRSCWHYVLIKSLPNFTLQARPDLATATSGEARRFLGPALPRSAHFPACWGKIFHCVSPGFEMRERGKKNKNRWSR